LTPAEPFIGGVFTNTIQRRIFTMSKWLLAMTPQPVEWSVTTTAQNETVSVQSVVEKVAPSIATVKVVLKTTMRMGGESMEEESKMSLQGVVVTPDGLIMVSNSPFSPRRMIEILAGEVMPAGMDYKMTPTSIKVTFGNEETRSIMPFSPRPTPSWTSPSSRWKGWVTGS
jgi:hypothetical protein